MPTALQVKELRERTGSGVMDCKKALIECGDDIEKAIDWLRAKGLATAAKKAGRAASEGVVYAHIEEGGRGGALLEVNCETDFVTKTEKFQQLVKGLVAHVWTAAPSFVTRAEAGEAPADTVLYEQMMDGKTIDAYLKESVAVIGENIQARRMARFVLSAEFGSVHAYIHGGGSHGVLIEVTTDKAEAAGDDRFKALVNELCLHVAAMGPEFVRREEVSQTAFDKERAVQLEKTIAEGKPEAMAAKIVDGRMNKWYEEVCLLDQGFLGDDKNKNRTRIAAVAKELGASIEVVRFSRLVMGEGIEKKESDFAAEVAAQAGLK